MGQSPELASKAQTYITIIMPNIFIAFTIAGIRKFLQGLGTFSKKKKKKVPILAIAVTIETTLFFIY